MAVRDQLKLRWEQAHGPPLEVRDEVVRLLGRLLVNAAKAETVHEEERDVGGQYEFEDHR
jgi:hypothetical protein